MTGIGLSGHGIAPRKPVSWCMRPDKMRVWLAAEQLMAEIDRLIPRVASRAANSADHLERSGESALFNIGEGTGAYKPNSKVAAYEIAKKEANEVRAILRRLVIKRVVTSHEVERAYELAGVIVAMLTSAIRSIEKRA